MKVYKVVEASTGRYYSANSGPGYHESIRLEYFINAVTQPLIPGSKLFVFVDLEDARSFRMSSSDLQIWEAEAENVERAERISGLYSYDPIQMFWNGKFKYYDVPPAGTHFCDSLYLVRRVNVQP